VCDRDVIRLGLAVASGSAVRRGSTFLERGRTLYERRGEADTAVCGTQSQRTAPEQAATQAVPELGPPIIVTFHNLGDAGQSTFLQGLQTITRSSESRLDSET
jgi:hypothetical protein